jgi:hypothetical protein
LPARPARVWPALAVLAAVVLAARFTWFAHGAGNGELLGAGIGLAAWPLAARLPQRWLLWLLAGALLGGLSYRGLAPFEFGALRHDLHWLPFTDLVGHTGTGFNLPLLAGKAFTYGSLVWLAVAAGAAALPAGLLAGGVLLLIEIAQLSTPPRGHVATLTDPAIAVCAGLVLMLLGTGTPAPAPRSRSRPAS